MSTGGKDRTSGAKGRLTLETAVISAMGQIARERAAFVQAVADRMGLAPTDVECLEMLDGSPGITAGALAEITGLTSGAVTRMIDRLEQAGYVTRMSDAADRRRVLIQSTPARAGTLRSHMESLTQASVRAMAPCNTADLARILDALHGNIEAIRGEVTRLRGATGTGKEQDSTFRAAVASTTAGRLVFLSGAPRILVLGDPDLAELCQARFAGSIPRVRIRDGIVTVRFGKYSWLDWRARMGEIMVDASVHWRDDRGEIRLNTSVPWDIELRGGASQLTFDLSRVTLRSFELLGGASKVEMDLPRPRGIVGVRMSGGANQVVLHRPRGTAVRLVVSGGAGRVSLDGRQARGGRELMLETPSADASADRFEVQVTGGVHRLSVDEQP